jgi:hypothetical protein
MQVQDEEVLTDVVPDGSKLNQRPHMPDKSGIEVVFAQTQARRVLPQRSISKLRDGSRFS